MAAANARIGVAKAAYYPLLNLTAAGGVESGTLTTLLQGPAGFWAVGASALQTVFDGGRRRAASDQAIAAYDQTVATYRETVLTSFQQVEDNLAALRILSRELKQQSDAVASSQRYLNLARDRYRLGIDSYLNVITAQTTLLGNQRTELNLRVDQLTQSVQLIEALGGDWNGSLALDTVKQ